MNLRQKDQIPPKEREKPGRDESVIFKLISKQNEQIFSYTHTHARTHAHTRTHARTHALPTHPSHPPHPTHAQRARARERERERERERINVWSLQTHFRTKTVQNSPCTKISVMIVHDAFPNNDNNSKTITPSKESCL